VCCIGIIVVINVMCDRVDDWRWADMTENVMDGLMAN
jgi:hypothetical protein